MINMAKMREKAMPLMLMKTNMMMIMVMLMLLLLLMMMMMMLMMMMPVKLKMVFEENWLAWPPFQLSKIGTRSQNQE